ncbi:hypothetical protein LTR78_003388 [Recurvomyces mirabilis]|uniref:Methyltransferase type 11 domain-containing protein n=1 Tax=Recurvomyces mirabilis TaxID=574656 RepID=A0AAE0WS43_9PEZI|nr:hypothetical protein LTR78_003388 [Recurvomyces mirabilis]KAK5154576.1 hypothetical protein LTS14_006714 [Recurvomyces mirabilis]
MSTTNDKPTINEKCPKTRIIATDIAPDMLAQVDALHLPDVTTKRVDGATLEGLGVGEFSHALSSFAISFIPEPRVLRKEEATDRVAIAVRSLYRVVKPGGMVGIATWSARIDWGLAIGTVAKRLKPDYAFHIPESASTWRTEVEHNAVLQAVGLKAVQTETVRMPLAVADAQGVVDYAFRGGKPRDEEDGGGLEGAGQGGSEGELEAEYARVVGEDFPDGVGRQVGRFGAERWGWQCDPAPNGWRVALCPCRSGEQAILLARDVEMVER